MRQLRCLLGIVAVCSLSTAAFAQDTGERLNALENAIKSQAKTIEEQQKTIEELKEQINKQQAPQEQQAVQEPQPKGEDESLSAKV
ncbi:MAG TPA: hypothetical protein VL949_07380, partial [Geobacteraceae bacterium]|nr:hypothetical protein [Geobacteraceae bacterium]